MGGAVVESCGASFVLSPKQTVPPLSSPSVLCYVHCLLKCFWRITASFTVTGWAPFAAEAVSGTRPQLLLQLKGRHRSHPFSWDLCLLASFFNCKQALPYVHTSNSLKSIICVSLPLGTFFLFFFFFDPFWMQPFLLWFNSAPLVANL